MIIKIMLFSYDRFRTYGLDGSERRLQSDGTAEFEGIEFGDHTLYVKDENGKVLASKAFKIVIGNELSLDGDVITAKTGDRKYLLLRYFHRILKLLVYYIFPDKASASGF